MSARRSSRSRSKPRSKRDGEGSGSESEPAPAPSPAPAASAAPVSAVPEAEKKVFEGLPDSFQQLLDFFERVERARAAVPRDHPYTSVALP